MTSIPWNIMFDWNIFACFGTLTTRYACVCVCVCVCVYVRTHTCAHTRVFVHLITFSPALYVNLWNVAHQAPLSMGFSRQQYYSGCHFLLQGIFPTQGLHLCFLCLLHCRWIL